MATTLNKGFKALALKLQEAMMQGDVCSRLCDALQDYAKAQGNPWGCFYLNHDGDGESGSVVYSCQNDIMMAPYEISDVNGKSSTIIDFDSAVDVVPVTTYQPEADDEDHYTAMESQKLYAKVPAYERFIPKAARKAASADSFAGKGRSFPILKAEDVSAALHSIGRAGTGNYSSDTLRANIKRIAKAKGFALPDSLKDDSSESRTGWKPDGVLLVEAAAFQETPLLEAGQMTDYPIKLISPGRGSSGYYPPETLKKAAENKVFAAGTQMFWNHATDAEESARPEGDLNHLAAVTTSDAQWMESGKDGPGLYARAKVFSDYADKVKEKGPHIGLSIRAGGMRDNEAQGPDGKKGVITQLKNAASVDFVTKAGRDGRIFTESAKTQIEQGGSMDKAEINTLIQEAVKAALAPALAETTRLREHLALTKAPALIMEALGDIRLPDAAKKRIVGRLEGSAPLNEAGQIDKVKLTAMVEAEAKLEADFLRDLGYGQNIPAMGQRMTEADRTAEPAARAKENADALANLTDLFVGPKVAGNELRESARAAFEKGRIQ